MNPEQFLILVPYLVEGFHTNQTPDNFSIKFAQVSLYAKIRQKRSHQFTGKNINIQNGVRYPYDASDTSLRPPSDPQNG
jgi:hypothetical protein